MALLPPKQHFGDLLGAEKNVTERTILASFSDPLDRLILTADGTLQLLVSAWHNRVVQVKVIKHVPDYELSMVNREIDLCFADDASGTSFCNAKSVVKFDNNDLMEKSRGFGIGQLFKEWNLLPRFEVLEAGRGFPDTGLWRRYRLSAQGIECTILETFPINPLMVTGSLASGEPVVSANRGLLSDARYSRAVPPELTNVQRIFCTANGNVQRLATALLGEQVQVRLSKEEVLTRGHYVRQVELIGASSNSLVCTARSRIDVGNEQMIARIEAGELSLGAIVRESGVYPRFELLDATYKSSRCFARTYSMSLESTGAVLTVQEDFDWSDDHKLGSLSDRL